MLPLRRRVNSYLPGRNGARAAESDPPASGDRGSDN